MYVCVVNSFAKHVVEPLFAVGESAQKSALFGLFLCDFHHILQQIFIFLKGLY